VFGATAKPFVPWHGVHICALVLPAAASAKAGEEAVATASAAATATATPSRDTMEPPYCE